MHTLTPARLCRVCATPLPPRVRQGHPPVTCSDACRRADRAAAQRTRRTIAAADLDASDRPPRDPANATTDAAFALATLPPLSWRICRLAYGFEDENPYDDDDIAANLNADANVAGHFSDVTVRRIREAALASMRASLALSAAEAEPFHLSPDEAEQATPALTRSPARIDPSRPLTGGLRPASEADDLVAAYIDAGWDADDVPLVYGEVTASGTQWPDHDVIGRDYDDTARWIRAAHGDAALDGFPLAHRSATTPDRAIRDRITAVIAATTHM